MTSRRASANGGPREALLSLCGARTMTFHLFPFTLFVYSFPPTPPRIPKCPSSVARLTCGKCSFVVAVANKRIGGTTSAAERLQNGSFPQNSSFPDVIHPFHLFAVSRTTKLVNLSLSPERRVSKYRHVRCLAEQSRRRRPTTSKATQCLDPIPLRQAPTAPSSRSRPAKADTSRSLKDNLCSMEDRIGRGPRNVR